MGDFETVFYANLNQMNPEADPQISCEASVIYDETLISNLDRSWRLSIEKLTVPVQNMPYFASWKGGRFFALENAITLKIGASTWNFDIPICYSLNQFLDAFRSIKKEEEEGAGVQEEALSDFISYVWLNKHGGLSIAFKDTEDNPWTITFHPYIQKLFGEEFIATHDEFKDKNLVKEFTRSVVNQIDILKRIVLQSYDLSTSSELDNNIPKKTLTTIDYSPAVTTTSSVLFDENGLKSESYSTSIQPRQDLELTPNYPRYIEMGGIPISTISIKAEAEIYITNQEGIPEIKVVPIPIPSGSIFNCKIAFWKKKV